MSLFLHYGDVTDGAGLRHILEKAQPDEIYNLAAQSHVRVSFDQAEYTADVVGTGALRLLEALREYAGSGRQVRFYQAGSSEMFGAARPPQNESTPFHPRSPYAASKVAAHCYCVNYREAYGLFISNGSSSTTSRRAARTFVTRKITRALTRIKLGLREAVPRQSRRQTRLGLCRRLCGGHVAHAPAPSPMTTSSPPANLIPCANSSISPPVAMSTGSGTSKPIRVISAPRSGFPDGRREQSSPRSWLETPGRLR